MSQTRPRKRRKRSKKFKFLIALMILGAVGGVVYFNMKKEKPPETFATVEVSLGKLVDKLAETGSIELVRTVEVKSTIAGEIRQLAVEAGDGVQKGQLLAVIEPDPNQSLQLYQKRSAVERGRLNLQEQEKDFARAKSLHESRMIPEKDFEDAQTRLVQVRNDLRLAELELEILETKANLSAAQKQASTEQLDEVRVLAPISGIVIRRDVEIGEVVASGLSAFSGGTLLFEVGDPSQMIVRGDIAEVDIAQLAVGQEVEIVVDAYPDTTYHGQVRWIAPVGQKKQGSPIVTFDTEIDILDREPRIRQGMSCDIDIIFTRRDSALFLPVEAVLEVFAEEEGEKREEVKGKRGRFITYVARPARADSATADSAMATSAAEEGAMAGAATAQTDGVAGEAPLASADPAVEAADSATAADAGRAVDSAGTDSAAGETPLASADTQERAAESSPAEVAVPADSDSAAADSAAAGKPKEPPKFELDAFVEVELQVGLETSTRVEILAGLEGGDQVAADPALIRRKKEEQAKAPKKEERKGWF